jgi:hypothetical protein
MSFVCDFCKSPAPKGVSPRIVDDLEPQREKIYTYTVIDPETSEREVRTSIGSEIIAEFRQCPNCYPEGTPKPVEVKDPNVGVYVVLGTSLQAHGKGCTGKKKNRIGESDECSTCKRNLETFSTIPSGALNKFLTEPLAKGMRVSVAVLVVDSMFDRTTHNTKRASRDFEAAYPIMKDYEQRGGRL